MATDEHRLLSQTGAATPMGRLLRRYWTPALLSRELEADGAPVRVRLLGEDLIAFRDSEGRAGLLGEHCAHRGASLYFGKNTEGGIRCWYHGWKYDIAGTCIEMPNEPPQTRFCDQVKHTAYPCIDRNGVVWAYLGPPDKKPALPELEFLEVPESQVYVWKRLQECHWLQGMDGDLDSSHLGFLHRNETLDTTPASAGYVTSQLASDDGHPKIEAVVTPAGLLHGARRDADAAHHYWRIGEWYLPGLTMIPGFSGDRALLGHAWVPIDDRQCWLFGFIWHPVRPLEAREKELPNGRSPLNCELLPGSFLPAHNRANGYADPGVPPTRQPWMRIRDFQDQDVAVTETMAPLGQAQETLGSTDITVAQMRHRLVTALRAVEDGRDPPGLDPKSFRMRPISTLLPRDCKSWAEAVAEMIDARPETYRPSA